MNSKLLSSAVIVDIETAPIADAADYLEPITAPANYKDPIKIEAYIKDQTQKEIENCSCDVDLAQVIAVGFLPVKGEQKAFLLPDTGNSEPDLLRLFWTEVGKHDMVVGFNCVGFDLPVILRRSLYLGIKPTRYFSLEKYRHPDVIDLMQELTYFGMLRYRGLTFYAKRMGYTAEKNIEGAEIPKAFKDGKWDDIKAHLRNDLVKTRVLAEKLGYYPSAGIAEEEDMLPWDK